MGNEKARTTNAPLTMEAETVPPPAEPTQVDLDVPKMPADDEMEPLPALTPTRGS